MKATQLYDFTLVANGSQVILADANFYKVLTSTGDLKITRDGGSTVRPMRAGRGEREVEFQRLTITDISGATNSGTIVVGDSNFIDDTIVLSSAINVRPEAQSGFYSMTATLAANTPEQIFSPASNVNGAILLTADCTCYDNSANGVEVFIAKTSAPSSITDGSILAMSKAGTIGTFLASNITLPSPQFIEAGKGLYFMATRTFTATAQSMRACRYKLL
jgi:hypothetical protein